MVMRTARVGVRVTPAQARRCFGLLRSGGDVWAWVLDCNRVLGQWRRPPVVSYQGLCRELAAMGVPFGELSATAARSVLRCYSDAWFAAAKRVGQGRPGRFPRRKRALMPLRWYAGTFALAERRLRLSVAAGRPPLVLRLARPVPYPPSQVRSVTLAVDGGRLAVDVSAEVPVEVHDLDPARVAGVDMGVIHPYAVVCGPDALVVSGRAARAEHHLHLADTKARSRAVARRAPTPGRRRSRRWRQARRAQQKADTGHRRRVRHGQHHAAKLVVEWAVAHRIGTLVVGDPKGICDRDFGPVHNRRLRTWDRTHLLGYLADKAALAGITVQLVDERGTSSTCPRCQRRVPKPKGRTFCCPHCGLTGHRDLVGAANIAAKRGGPTVTGPVTVTHRRAGPRPARRDRRRHQMDRRRSSPAAGRPGTTTPGSRSAKTASVNRPNRPKMPPPPGRTEDQPTQPNKANVG